LHGDWDTGASDIDPAAGSDPPGRMKSSMVLFAAMIRSKLSPADIRLMMSTVPLQVVSTFRPLARSNCDKLKIGFAGRQ
jgi:hypothetical protein